MSHVDVNTVLMDRACKACTVFDNQKRCITKRMVIQHLQRLAAKAIYDQHHSVVKHPFFSTFGPDEVWVNRPYPPPVESRDPWFDLPRIVDPPTFKPPFRFFRSRFSSFDSTTTIEHFEHFPSNACEDIVHRLRNDPAFTTLRLVSCKLPPGTMTIIADALKSNTSCTTLDVIDCDIQWQGAKAVSDALSMNDTLQHVNLSSNYISREGFDGFGRAISPHKSLQSLDLSDNSIRPEALFRLSLGLGNNSSIRHLNLSSTYIGAPGMRHFVHVFKTNSTLRSVNLSHNYIPPDEVTRIAKYLRRDNRSLTSLDIICCEVQPAQLGGFIEALLLNTTLTSLNVENRRERSSIGLSIDNLCAANKALFFKKSAIYGEFVRCRVRASRPGAKPNPISRLTDDLLRKIVGCVEREYAYAHGRAHGYEREHERATHSPK